MRRVGTLVVALLALVGLAATVAAAWFAAGGIAAKPQPDRLETAIARSLRSAVIPREAKARTNALPASGEVIRDGMEHFADHCATCHANNGSGDTLYGRTMYPRVPDLRLDATQKLSDGELFYIIQNGVKLTGMPAFGSDDEQSHESWGLVHFIRHLPKLTDAELQAMELMNPRPLEEWRQMEREGKLPQDPGAAKPHTHKN